MGLLLLYYPLVLWQLSLFNIDMNAWFIDDKHDDLPFLNMMTFQWAASEKTRG